jgi:hypothetical protein
MVPTGPQSRSRLCGKRKNLALTVNIRNKIRRPTTGWAWMMIFCGKGPPPFFFFFFYKHHLNVYGSLICFLSELMKWYFYTNICLKGPTPIMPPKENSRDIRPGMELGTSRMRTSVLSTQTQRSVRWDFSVYSRVSYLDARIWEKSTFGYNHATEMQGGQLVSGGFP